MSDLFEVAVKAYIKAFLFIQFVTNAVHKIGVSF
jgi:hypothetical protein